MKVKGTYVKCDVCWQRIDHRPPFTKIDMCTNCYDKYSELAHKELKEEKKND